ncbi:MAG: DUF2267 domain-containing protein [Bradymonadaceae bacterium]|nr:DUF2267 domain-containing protein [Lujinxingiaceae bacterium]
MSMTGLRNLDRAIQTTNQWLADLDQKLAWGDRQRSYAALRTVLHALRDELVLEEAVQLGAQLPMIIRGMYFEGWQPRKVPIKERDVETFLGRVAEGYTQAPGSKVIDPEWLTRAVFALLQDYVSAGEIDDVKGMLTKGIAALWTTPGEPSAQPREDGARR